MIRGVRRCGELIMRIADCRCPGVSLLALVLVGASGCTPTSQPSMSGQAADSKPGSDAGVNSFNNNTIIITRGNNNVVNTWDSKATVNGISFEVRGSGSAQTQINDNNVSIKRGTSHLEFKAGRLFANGQEAGTAKEGDVV